MTNIYEIWTFSEFIRDIVADRFKINDLGDYEFITGSESTAVVPRGALIVKKNDGGE